MKTRQPFWLGGLIVLGIALIGWVSPSASAGPSVFTQGVDPDSGDPAVSAGCTELIVNGGFEWNGAWELPLTAYSAVYSSQRAIAGSRSLRTGIDGGSDVFSYSAANQLLTIPASAPSVSLDFWWYPLSEEGSTASAAAVAPLDAEQLRQLAAGTLERGVLASDQQYVLLLNSAGDVINQVLWTRSDARSWQHTSVDVTLYRGQTLRLAFGTFNDGDGLRTAMFVDEVYVKVCPSPPISTATPTPTQTGPGRQGRLPLILRGYQPALTATPSPTPSTGPLDERWLRSLVVAPGSPGRLIGVTNQGHLMDSTDFAATWGTIPLPSSVDGDPLRYRGFVGMAYQAPQNLYLGANWMGLWASTDGGASWLQRNAFQIGPVSVSLSQHTDLWAGMLHWDNIGSRVGFSSDAGQHWSAAGASVDGDPVSPILIDTHDGSVIYLVTQGPAGGGTLYRNVGSGWQAVSNAPIGALPSGGPGIGLALDAGSRGLYIGGADGKLYVSYNAYTADVTAVTWQLVHAFDPAYYPIPLAIGGSTGGSELYLTLFDWGTWRGRTMRSLDGGANWQPLAIPVPYLPGGTPSPTPTPTATTHPPTTCYEALSNGSFETYSGWTIKDNPVLAGYVTWPVHAGGRSMRTGIAYGGANTLSYSPIEQAVAFPSVWSGLTAQLRFWHYNVYGDNVTAGVADGRTIDEEVDLSTLPQTEEELATTPLAGDFFYAIAIHSNGAIDWLQVQRLTTIGWFQSVVDVGGYRGQSIRFQFGTYNDGLGGVSRTYVDDASLVICP